jgi:hypothetical protein
VAARLAHDRLDDRFLAPLEPRRELLEALCSLAFWATDKRRRKAGLRKLSILKVEIWVQASQARVIAAYRRHLAYIKSAREPMVGRTLSRHVRRAKEMKLLRVVNPSHYDRRRKTWIREDNVYTLSYFGKLWIKRHARSVKIPLVV